MKHSAKWAIGISIAGTAVLSLIAGIVRVGEHVRTNDYSELAAEVEAARPQLDYAVKLARDGSFPSRRFDRSSVGFSMSETKLIEISRDISVYETVYHHLPVSLAELERLELPEVGKKIWRNQKRSAE